MADAPAREISDLVTDGRYELAEPAYAEGDPETAHRHMHLVLEADPLREPAWRLAMRVAELSPKAEPPQREHSPPDGNATAEGTHSVL